MSPHPVQYYGRQSTSPGIWTWSTRERQTGFSWSGVQRKMQKLKIREFSKFNYWFGDNNLLGG